MISQNSNKRQDIIKIIGSCMLSTEEIMYAMGLSQSSFSRFAKRSSLKPIRTIGRLNFYHVDDFETAIRNKTKMFEVIELIKNKKTGENDD